MNESDERYSTVEDAIFGAYFELMKEKDMDRITVSDVIKKAGIVRSTFYNHYENIPALATAAEDKTIRDIFTMMESFKSQTVREMCHSYYLSICEYTRNNPFLSNLLKSPKGDDFFEKAITMFHKYVTEASGSTVQNTERPVSSYFIAGAIGSTIGVLHKWIAEDFSSPAEDIANILSRIFLSGILPYLTTSK